MKRYLMAAALVAGGLLVPAAAYATDTPATCTVPDGWYANPDEQDRIPTPTVGGLKFEGNDLIHHAAAGTVEDLTHGTFTAAPAPDQDSFFSVEVAGDDGGYGTLRWNTTTSKWNLTTGGQFYENTDPAALADMPPAKRSHHVVSFGVGYTANPPGAVATVVSTVTYGGTSYNLKCSPPVVVTTSASASHTASPSASASHTAKPSASATKTSSTAAAVAGPSLPVTGSPVGLVVGTGAALMLVGAALMLVTRRRKARFTA